MDVEVWGIEVDEEVVQEAEKSIDRILVGTIEDQLKHLPVEYFDCIVYNDVLEHLVDPWGVLKEAKKLLTQNGCVVASIPNMRFYDVLKQLLINKQWRYREAGIMDITHLRFFTINSIRDMFLSAGYKIELLKGINYERMPLFYYLLNLCTLNSFGDLRYVQFACVARKA
jgi:2-polyprenyl-3-methyl-5-hydroxy-6-metoxy-1,4-benzoquinol methylase